MSGGDPSSTVKISMALYDSLRELIIVYAREDVERKKSASVNDAVIIARVDYDELICLLQNARQYIRSDAPIQPIRLLASIDAALAKIAQP